MMATFFHWRLHDNGREQFVTAWAEVTEALKNHGSLGSALFEQEDGTMRALARWPDRTTRDRAFDQLDLPDAVTAMRDATAETLLRVDVDEIDNRWVSP